MKLSRIDQIALNGGDGAHYKYEEVALLLVKYLYNGSQVNLIETKNEVVKILVENFPDDATK